MTALALVENNSFILGTDFGNVEDGGNCSFVRTAFKFQNDDVILAEEKVLSLTLVPVRICNVIFVNLF